ncbi:hypothetical protein V8C86DRAFT_2880345, partial [Haematococcus lacustris]
LIPLLHFCLEDPWAAVGLMLILTTAKHLWSPTAAKAARRGNASGHQFISPVATRIENGIAKLIMSSRQCSTIDKRGPNLLATPL